MAKLEKLAAVLLSLKKNARTEKQAVTGFDHSEPYIEYVMRDGRMYSLENLKIEAGKRIKPVFGMGDEIEALVDFAASQIFIERYRVDFESKFDDEQWKKPSCPMCGGLAGLARIDGAGTRRLVCHLCWTEWRFDRFRCSSCGEIRDEYALFETDGRDVRVELCGACKNYVKTYCDLESFDSPPLADARTMFIDDWATGQGYKRKSPGLMGIDYTK